MATVHTHRKPGTGTQVLTMSNIPHVVCEKRKHEDAKWQQPVNKEIQNENTNLTLVSKRNSGTMSPIIVAERGRTRLCHASGMRCQHAVCDYDCKQHINLALQRDCRKNGKYKIIE